MPALSSSSLITIFLAFILLYLTYIAFTMKNRIWCTFRRQDRTKIEKWAKQDQGRIEFDNGWYHVEPARTIIQWKTMLGFFPMPVRTLDFRWNSTRALHPDTFDTIFTPEERKQLDKTDNIRGLMVASQQALGVKQKQGLLQQYMPLIVIVGFAIVGFIIYQQGHKLDMIGMQGNILEAQLAKLLAR